MEGGRDRVTSARSINGRYLVIAAVIFGLLVGLGMATSVVTIPPDESYQPPVGTPTPTPQTFPWGSG